MTRSIVAGLLGVISIGFLATIPLACQGGGVGDPCTPEDEYDPQFGGFKVTEENIESRSFQCQSRICLVNHFQGRVSCPLGQQDTQVKQCSPNNMGSDCAAGENCVESASIAAPCDPTHANKGNDDCLGFGNKCNAAGKFCECGTSSDCLNLGTPSHPFFCEEKSHQCKAFACHATNNCQLATNDDAHNVTAAGLPKDCCIPGTDTPVVTPVCGQCRGPTGKQSTRGADQAVYCSCRCGVAQDEPDDPNFNFCTCPSGFSCEEIRKNVGLGDPEITGKYCIKDDTKFVDANQCGNVKGAFPSEASCSGIQE